MNGNRFLITQNPEDHVLHDYVSIFTFGGIHEKDAILDFQSHALSTARIARVFLCFHGWYDLW